MRIDGRKNNNGSSLTTVSSFPLCNTRYQIKTGLLLLALWFITLSVNLFKPVHIDDPVHLTAAQWIIHHPLRPMSFTINWGDHCTPGYLSNHPPLIYYYLAVLMKLFGNSEMMLHIGFSLFSLMSIMVFFLTADLIGKNPLKLTALFALSPAFLVSQNLMLDTPLTAILLLFIYLIIRESKYPIPSKKVSAIAGGVLGGAFLIKYTSLAIFPVYAFYLYKRYGIKGVFLVVVPLVILVCWSCFNIGEFGSIHILRKSMTLGSETPDGYFALVIAIVKPFLWILGLGSVALFGLWTAKGYSNGTIVGIVAISVIVSVAGFSKGGFIQQGLGGVFLFSGVLLSIEMVNSYRAHSNVMIVQIITLGILGLLLFSIFIAPFMAIRHILPAFPLILLLLSIGKKEVAIVKACPLVLHSIVGIILAFSDSIYAGAFKNAVPEIRKKVTLEEHQILWHNGCWGFQWYAEKNGMKRINDYSQMKKDDYLADIVFERTSSVEDFCRKVTLIDSVVIKSDWRTWIRTMNSNRRGFYSYSRDVPWTLSTKPLIRFYIYQVK